jgi:hypothetical protein
VINGLHGEIERHELDDRLQSRHGRADTKTGKAVFGDRGVDHPLVAELLQQVAADLVGALVLGHFLAHQEDVRIAAHFLGHGVAQGVTDRHLHQFHALRQLGILQRFRHRDRRRRFRRRADRIARSRGPGGRFRIALRRRGRIGLRRRRSHPGLARQAGDGRVDLHLLRAFRHQQGLDSPFVDGFHLHGGLIGLDLGDHVAGFHRVADLHVPFRECALLHGRRERGHQDVGHAVTAASV